MWKERKILLDGHNRLALCRKHNISFAVKEVAFSSREEAEAFIVEHQLGKRNLSPEAASYYRGKRYLAEKRMHGGNRSLETASGNSYHSTTAKRLAAVYRVAEKTIRNDGKFTEAVDAIAGNCGEKAVPAILARDTGLRRGAAVRLSKMTPDEQQQAMEQLFAKGKIPRRSGDGESANVTLPREPTALAAKLLAKFGVEASSKVLTALSKLLETRDEKA